MAYRKMKVVNHKNLLTFRKKVKEIEIDNVKVALKGPYKVKKIAPAEEYTPEIETVWSFPSRGDWATHRGNYRGNWSPYIPRNLILRYTEEGDLVVDQMMGSGTTLVEAHLLGRRGIGIDINLNSVMVARDRLDFDFNLSLEMPPLMPIETFVGDARNLNRIKDDSVDLVVSHPPYAGIIGYSKNDVEGELSALKLGDYLDGMRESAAEALRILKPGAHCGVLIGDTRKHLHYIPISQRVMHGFLDAGFMLREDIIKLQWKMKATRERWGGASQSFYKIAHEHLFVFRKPDVDERTTRLKNSKKWW